MSDINEENVIIVLGDLGAGANFVKNILLLSSDIDFPIPSRQRSRIETIKTLVYPDCLKFNPSNWIRYEYFLRTWKQHYGVDISDNYNDINTAQVQNITQKQKVVFLSHWPEIVKKIKTKYPKIKVVSVCATTDEEVSWQVSQYISKIGFEKLQNFSFQNNIEEQKLSYISKYGNNEYLRLNALNMLEILTERKSTYVDNNYITIKISQLQEDHWIVELANKLNIKLDLSQAFSLANTWRNLNPKFIRYWDKDYNETN